MRAWIRTTFPTNKREEMDRAPSGFYVEDVEFVFEVLPNSSRLSISIQGKKGPAGWHNQYAHAIVSSNDAVKICNWLAEKYSDHEKQESDVRLK